MNSRNQLRLHSSTKTSTSNPVTPGAVARAFDPARLTQARYLAMRSKKEVANELHVSPAAVGQYETGSSKPRPDLVPTLADFLNVPMGFFIAGRPRGSLDASMAHFRSLRSTRVAQRLKAVATVEQIWELAFALERRIQLPWMNLPGFSGGEVHPGEALPKEPARAARALRKMWGLGNGPIGHLVRHMESNGIVVVTPPADPDSITVDAFSTAHLPRPVVVLTANRADDVYRHRFTAAHELGHLVLHGDVMPGDARQEREADAFAAEFLTPRAEVLPELPRRLDLSRLAEIQRVWGVSVMSLIYRSREVGLMSDSAASRAYQQLHALREAPGFSPEPLASFPGEQPIMLNKAMQLAFDKCELTLLDLADELVWKTSRLNELLSIPDTRPALRIVPSEGTQAAYSTTPLFEVAVPIAEGFH
jgi:Zn-dependent peptidase ImmA (M78 family)/transcriptional regulator with XRE-family HTH domain